MAVVASGVQRAVAVGSGWWQVVAGGGRWWPVVAGDGMQVRAGYTTKKGRLQVGRLHIESSCLHLYREQVA